MKITRKQLRRLISESLGPKYDKHGKLVSQVVSPHLTMRSLPHSYQMPNVRRPPEEYLDPEDTDAYFDKIRTLRYNDAHQADELALGVGAEPPETGFFDASRSFADEMEARARVEDRDEDGYMGYDSVQEFSADSNNQFRRLQGMSFDAPRGPLSKLYKLVDDLAGVDIVRVIMKLKEYMQTREYNTLDSDLKDQVKDTIASLESDYNKKIGKIFGEK